MSMKQRRIISAVSPEAAELLAQREAAGLDCITGRPVCGGGAGCSCPADFGKARKGKKPGEMGGGNNPGEGA